MTLTRQQVMELLGSFTDSVFRLECLQEYTVPQEAARLAAFLSGDPLPPRPPEGLATIRNLVAAGKRVSRVHIVDQPLSSYVRFELAEYPQNVAAGEDVRIADRTAHPDLDRLREDFLLFDSDTDHPVVVWVRYTADGQVAGYERSDDPAEIARCRWARDLALAHSLPLDEFSARVR